MTIQEMIDKTYSTWAKATAPKYSSLEYYSSSLLRSVLKDASPELAAEIKTILSKRGA